MASKLKKSLLSPIPYLFPDRFGTSIARRCSKSLMEELSGKVTDDFLKLLLMGMDLAFCLSKDYRKNIEDFEGRYLFETKGGLVENSATFKNGNMKVHDEAIADWDAKVTFMKPESFWKFIFSKDQNILDSILRNEVETDGNLNYIYKFGFMARDLSRRLGVG